MDSEAEVAGWLQAWIIDPLRYFVRQVSPGATWKQQPPNVIIQDAAMYAVGTCAVAVRPTVGGCSLYMPVCWVMQDRPFCACTAFQLWGLPCPVSCNIALVGTQ